MYRHYRTLHNDAHRSRFENVFGFLNDSKMRCFSRVILFLNGIAYGVHHLGACLLYSAGSGGHLAPIEAFQMVVMANLLQHATTWIGFWANLRIVSSLVLFALEVWFNLETYFAWSLLELFPQIGIGLVLASHYNNMCMHMCMHMWLILLL